MAFAVKEQDFYDEIQRHLLETVDKGLFTTAPDTGLFTEVEVTGRVNHRLQEFAKLTSLVAKHSTTTSSTANTVAQNVPSDAIDIIRISFPDTNGKNIPIPRSSSVEMDLTVTDLLGSNAAQDVPDLWTLDTATKLTVNFLPPPDASRAIDYVYVVRPATVVSTPDTTVLDLPDDFTPYIKYGVLADLWGKGGETHDPVRSAICQQLYELGIEIGMAWASGLMFD